MNSYPVSGQKHRLLDTPNSQKGKRPDFPRWLRRAARGKNKRHIKRSIARAFAQGIFTKEQHSTARRIHHVA